MSLVNILLKLLSLNMAYTLIFLLKNVSSFCKCKSYSHSFSKNNCELDTVLTRVVNILTTKELVKLTMLWTTGPWRNKKKKKWLSWDTISFDKTRVQQEILIFQIERRKQEEKMKRDQLNDTYLDLIEKQRLYFKTVKDFKEVFYNIYYVYSVLSKVSHIAKFPP